MVTFRNNEKKYWFSQEARLGSVHGNVFKDRSRNSVTFKMELFATIGNGRAYNQWTVVFACCCGNSTMFKGKIKIGENGHALKAASDTLSCFVDMFETSITFCFTNILFHFEN